jgi:hypothetical protein
VTYQIANEVGRAGVQAPKDGALHEANRTRQHGNDVYANGVANSIGHGEVAPSGLKPIGG